MDENEVMKAVIGAGFGAGLLGLVLGLALGGGPSEGISYTAANALGEKIGRGIAQAACIEARGEWSIDDCRFPKAP
jgi:hypothetical protein